MNLKFDFLKFDFLKNYKVYQKKYFSNLGEAEKEKAIGYIYIILTLFCVSFFGLFAINPTFSTISDLQRQYEDNKFVEKSLSTKINALNQLSMQYEEISSSLEIIYSAIPVSPIIPTFSRQVEKLANQNNLNLKRLDTGTIELFPAKKKQANTYSFPFNISVEGSEIDINNFVLDVINFDRIVTIDAINIDKGEKGTFSAFISGKAYFNK